MSPRGADLFFDILKSQSSPPPDILGQSRVVAVGPKTKSSLTRQGIQKVHTPERYSSDGVAELLTKFPLQLKRVILARSSQASDSLARKLKATGASVTTIAMYESSIPSNHDSVSSFLTELRSGTVDATLFTSALSATNLFEMSQAESKPGELRELLTNSLVGAIGPTTAAKLRKLGVTRAFIPERYTIDRALTGLVNTVEKKAPVHFRPRTSKPPEQSSCSAFSGSVKLTVDGSVCNWSVANGPAHLGALGVSGFGRPLFPMSPVPSSDHTPKHLFNAIWEAFLASSISRVFSSSDIDTG